MIVPIGYLRMLDKMIRNDEVLRRIGDRREFLPIIDDIDVDQWFVRQLWVVEPQVVNIHPINVNHLAPWRNAQRIVQGPDFES